MSDTSTSPAEKPVNDGGGSAPQPDSQPTDQQVTAETQVSPDSDGD